jgi:hypothetical protein
MPIPPLTDLKEPNGMCTFYSKKVGRNKEICQKAGSFTPRITKNPLLPTPKPPDGRATPMACKHNFHPTTKPNTLQAPSSHIVRRRGTLFPWPAPSIHNLQAPIATRALNDDTPTGTMANSRLSSLPHTAAAYQSMVCVVDFHRQAW